MRTPPWLHPCFCFSNHRMSSGPSKFKCAVLYTFELQVTALRLKGGGQKMKIISEYRCVSNTAIFRASNRVLEYISSVDLY